MATCSFCGSTLTPGTGKLLVKNDGKLMYFCSSKCENNSQNLNRNPRKIRWTTASRKDLGKE
ncbi:MAG: 50S ribosomal protein L24e [Candidatus Woesearchaeota archaeon]